MKSQGFSVIFTLILVGIAGCSSRPQGKLDVGRRYITIHTQPEGADVKQAALQGIPSVDIGVTPIIEQPVWVITKIRKMKNLPVSETLKVYRTVGGVSVIISKNGYKTYRGILKTDAKKTLVHNITLQKNNNEKGGRLL